MSKHREVPRRRKASDEIYNVRRRLKRGAARARRLGHPEVGERLDQIVQQSVYDRGIGGYAYGTGQLLVEGQGLLGLISKEETKRRVKEGGRGLTREQRSNRAFRAGLQAAQQGIPNEATEFTGRPAQIEFSIFMTATRGIWESVPGGQRDPLAVTASVLGMSEQEAYDYILSQQVEARERLRDLADQIQEYEDESRTMRETVGVSLDSGAADEWYSQVQSLVNVFR